MKSLRTNRPRWSGQTRLSKAEVSQEAPEETTDEKPHKDKPLLFMLELSESVNEQVKTTEETQYTFPDLILKCMDQNDNPADE